jgi:superkiller protein 3
VQASLDHAGSDSQLLRRLLRVELFDVPQQEDGPVEFRQAVDASPHLTTNLGVSLEPQHTRGAAEAAFRKAIDLQPDFADAYYNLGNALTGQGEHVAAEVACANC